LNKLMRALVPIDRTRVGEAPLDFLRRRSSTRPIELVLARSSQPARVEHMTSAESCRAPAYGQLPVARSTATGDVYILRARPASEDEGVHAQRLVVESAVRLSA
jgi:hypothetical protein